jgi:hypothetical protein
MLGHIVRVAMSGGLALGRCVIVPLFDCGMRCFSRHCRHAAIE